MEQPPTDPRRSTSSRILWIVVEITLVVVILALLALFLLPAWQSSR